VLSVSSVLLLSSISIVIGLSCIWAVHLWYRIRLSRYEQFLHKTYIAHFEHRAVKALAVHASLARALTRSKAVVDQVRQAAPEATTTRAALQEVSELLEGMAIDSDRAIRELETINPETTISVGTADPRRTP
jgi:hypothetical protein